MDEAEAQSRVDWLLAQLPVSELGRLSGLKDCSLPSTDQPQLPRLPGGPGGLEFPEPARRTMATAACLHSK